MTTTHAPVIIYVTYQGTAETRFDRDYYVAHHLRLVSEAWTPCGLESVAAFFPDTVEATGTIALCACRFRDAAAMEQAFASPATVAVMADVSRFTDVVPARARAIPL